MKKIIDLLIFGGQSNMQGQTESLPEVNLPITHALEYRLSINELIPLRHPVGETLCDGLLLKAHEGHGSLVPAFCKTYTTLTKRNVVAVHVARGNTTIDEWSEGTPRYICALNKINSAKEKIKTIGKIGKIYYIWLQGESDAISGTSEQVYFQKLAAYGNALKKDVKIDKFGIIEVGYFASIVKWLPERSKKERRRNDEAIMRAQERIVGELPELFVTLTQICKKLSLKTEYINPLEDGHYNNLAMELIGESAGKTLALLVNNERNKC